MIAEIFAHQFSPDIEVCGNFANSIGILPFEAASRAEL
jgi:hypothetical protein